MSFSVEIRSPEWICSAENMTVSLWPERDGKSKLMAGNLVRSEDEVVQINSKWSSAKFFNWNFPQKVIFRRI